MNRAFFLLIAAAAAASACSKSNPPPAPDNCGSCKVAMTVNPTTFPVGGSTTASIAVTSFTLKDFDAQTELGIENGSIPFDPTVGHYHIYLDSTDVEPLIDGGATATSKVIVPCVTDKPVMPGPHTLIARLHYSDHKIAHDGNGNELKSAASITLTPPPPNGCGAGGAGGATATSSAATGTGGSGGANKM